MPVILWLLGVPLGVVLLLMLFRVVGGSASRRLAALQKLAHAIERLEDVLGRVGVG